MSLFSGPEDKNCKSYMIPDGVTEIGINTFAGCESLTSIKIPNSVTKIGINTFAGCESLTSIEIPNSVTEVASTILNELTPCIDDLNHIFQSQGYGFKARVIANDSFDEQVFQPILLASEGIADTSELFIRSYQMYRMFSKKDSSGTSPVKTAEAVKTESASLLQGSYNELKIGKLVQLVLKPLLVSSATEEEIRLMQEAEYSRKTFGIQHPLLLKTQLDKAPRYYKGLIDIRGEQYLLCSEWYETAANNDRPYVEKWIKEHQ